MRFIVLVGALMLATAGCEVYIEGEPVHDHASTACYEPEPYSWRAEHYRDYYNHADFFVGECGEWYVGQGWYEEWCNWHDVCGWEFVAEYRGYR